MENLSRLVDALLTKEAISHTELDDMASYIKEGGIMPDGQRAKWPKTFLEFKRGVKQFEADFGLGETITPEDWKDVERYMVEVHGFTPINGGR